MTDVLTMSEIETRFDGEWVLIADPEIDENLSIAGGRVIYHSRDRDEFDRESLHVAGARIAVRHIGDPAPWTPEPPAL